jgi:hypothetical protein
MDDSAGTPAGRYKDALMLLETAAWRETGAVTSLQVFTEAGSPAARLVTTARAKVQNLAATLRRNIDDFCQQATGQKPAVVLSEAEGQAAARIPAWKASLLDIQTEKVRLLRGVEDMHWHYAFEVNNLIDGKRSVLDIYRIVRAAALSAGDWYYGSVELAGVNKLLDSLEKAGAVTIRTR